MELAELVKKHFDILDDLAELKQKQAEIDTDLIPMLIETGHRQFISVNWRGVFNEFINTRR